MNSLSLDSSFFFLCVCVTLQFLYSRVRLGRSSTAFALARVFFCCEVGDIEKEETAKKKTRRDGLVHMKVYYKKKKQKKKKRPRREKTKLSVNAREEEKKRGETRLVGPFR